MGQVNINWNKVFENLMQPPKYALFIGYFEDSEKYEDGTKLCDVALYNEYGTISKKGNVHIPARPFLRNTANNKDNIKKWSNIIKLELSKHSNLKKAFEVVATIAVGDVKKTIQNTTEPANAQSTIDRKGSSHPLIDTGLLLGGVGYKIKANK